MSRSASRLCALALPPIMIMVLPMAALADLSIVTKERVETPGQPPTTSTHTLRYRGAKSRFDREPGQYAVMDWQSGEASIVDEDRKEVRVLSRGDTRAIGAAQRLFFGGVMEPLTNLSVNRTGRVATVRGYRCHEYVGTGTGVRFIAWATEEIDTTGIPAFTDTAAHDMFPGILPRLSIQGIVMKSELQIDLDGVSTTISSEVQRITRTVLPDALFVVPHTYATQRGIGPSPAERQASDRLVKEITRRRQGLSGARASARRRLSSRVRRLTTISRQGTRACTSR